MPWSDRLWLQGRQLAHTRLRCAPVRGEVGRRPVQLRRLREVCRKETLRFRRTERIAHQQRAVALTEEADMTRRMPWRMEQRPSRHLYQTQVRALTGQCLQPCPKIHGTARQ